MLQYNRMLQLPCLFVSFNTPYKMTNRYHVCIAVQRNTYTLDSLNICDYFAPAGQKELQEIQNAGI